MHKLGLTEFKGHSKALLSVTDAPKENEMIHDISKLQEQVQQMSRSQKLTDANINGVESKINGVESKIKGMEANMDDPKTDLKRDMADLKTNMDELKINMNKLLQEMGTKGERKGGLDHY